MIIFQEAYVKLFLRQSWDIVRDGIIFSNDLALPNGNPLIVSEDSMAAAGNRAAIHGGQMLAQFGADFGLGFGDVAPFVGIIHDVIQFFRAVNVADEPPFFGDDGVIALIVAYKCRSLAGRTSIPQLRNEAQAFERMGGSGQASVG
jgi:hypothetical protein